MDLVGLNVPTAYRGRQVIDALPIIYTLPNGFVAVSAGGTATALIQTQQNTVFRCLYITAKVRDELGTDNVWTNDAMKFQLTKVDSGQKLFTEQVSATACAGIGGGLPYVLPIPFDVEGSGNIQADFTNVNTTDNVRFELYLHGFKMFLQ